jgi:hypothetical protein
MDKRIEINGVRLPYTIENYGFKTDISEGNEHYANIGHKGNVLDEPIVEDDESTLFLEHCISKKDQKKLYWLMWYDTNGNPITTKSPVFGKEELMKIINKLIDVKLK